MRKELKMVKRFMPRNEKKNNNLLLFEYSKIEEISTTAKISPKQF